MDALLSTIVLLVLMLISAQLVEVGQETHTFKRESACIFVSFDFSL